MSDPFKLSFLYFDGNGGFGGSVDVGAGAVVTGKALSALGT